MAGTELHETDNIVTASNYRLVATSFWESAKVLYINRTVKSDGHTSLINLPPVYYLVSHACELFLKGALLKRGISEKDLKRQHIRHNLNGLVDALNKAGLDLTEDTKNLINTLSLIHEKHYLRYFLVVNHDMYSITMASIEDAMEELLMATRLNR
jgi:hypothetical protein